MKAYFKACDLSERQLFKNSSCILPISVGQGLKVHEGDKLQATINLVNKSFKHCTILIDDTLQRHTLKIFDKNLTKEALTAVTLNDGDTWLLRNKAVYETLTIDYKILRWDDWLNHQNYLSQRAQIDKLYSANTNFKNAVDLAINQYIRRSLLKQSALFDYRYVYSCCMEYLLEECTVMCLWAEEHYDFEVYPSGRNPAMTAAHTHCIQNNKKMSKLVSVSLYFRNTVIINHLLYYTNNIQQKYDVDILNAVNLLPVNIYLKDQIGQFIWCNNSQLKALGVSNLSDIVGKTDFHFRTMDVASKIWQNDCTVINSARLVTTEEVVIENHLEVCYLSRKTPLLDQNSNIIGILGVSIDVSEQKNQFNQSIKFKEQDVKTLENILAMVPVHIYWKDYNGIYLGCSDLQAKNLGFKNRHEIIGKTDFDLSESVEAANAFRNNDLAVINSGENVIVEEIVVIDKRQTPVLSYKAPLYNELEKPIGIAGVSVDITAQKEAEKLRFTNAKQQTVLEEQEKFKKIVGQMLHDIQSPLSGLSTLIESSSSILPEETRINMRHAVASIGDMTKNMLSGYSQNLDADNVAAENSSKVELLASLSLLQALSAKRFEYKKHTNIKFEESFDKDSNFAFIKNNAGDFKRMLSNLINNAVDAVMNKPQGIIKVRLIANPMNVCVFIRDNGDGMPLHIQEMFLQGKSMSEGKDDTHHGIGLTQVWDAINKYGGSIDISVNEGTQVLLKFPVVEAPRWIAREIKLTKDDLVVIVDDDKSIHAAWESRLQPLMQNFPEIKIKHYEQGREAIEFLNSLSTEQRQDTILLTDYELLNQNLNGLDIIAATKMQRAILVTSHASSDIEMQERAIAAGIKALPKELTAFVPIRVDKKIVPGSRCVDMVWVEDNVGFRDILINAYYKDLTIDKYINPDLFMEEVIKYPLDTRIILDTYYYNEKEQPYTLDGLVMAKALHEMGFNNLVLFSGDDYKKMPHYLKFVSKKDEKNKRILHKV